MSQESRVRLRWPQSMDRPRSMPEPQLKAVEGEIRDTPVYRGQAGFRTRPGWSGFDPVDSAAEAARMLGLFIRYLLHRIA